MARIRFDSLAAGGLNWDSLPLKLFAGVNDIPFGLTLDEFMQYASDNGMRRFGTISSARGRPVGDVDVDVDHTPVRLEDTFADEDEQALALAMAAGGR